MQMLNDFFMFVAPGLTIIAAIILSIWAAGKDDVIRDNED